MAEEDPLDSILLRSRFIGPVGPPFSTPSSSSSSDGERGDASARYRISHRPVTMRSASDSHRASSSSSSPSSSDARSSGGGGGGSGSGKVARPLGAEERPDPGDGGEESGFSRKGGDSLLGGMGEKKSCVSKRKRSPEEEGQAADRSGKKRRSFSDETTQEPADSPVASPRGKVVAKRLGFSGSRKEVAEPAGKAGDPQVNRSVVEDASREDRSANDEFAQFRYVRTGPPPLCHSPQLLKGAHGSPKSDRRVARSAPQQRSPVARDPPHGEVIKGVAIAGPQATGQGDRGLQRPSPSIRDTADGERQHGSHASAGFDGSVPQEAGPNTSVQPQTSVQPEAERPPRTALGTSSPVEIPKQSGGQRAVERSPSGGAQSPPLSPTGTAEIKGPSDLVDILLKLSKKPDKRLENVDFLEVLAMKGIHIPPPSWWRPGGYSSEEKESITEEQRSEECVNKERV